MVKTDEGGDTCLWNNAGQEHVDSESISPHVCLTITSHNSEASRAGVNGPGAWSVLEPQPDPALGYLRGCLSAKYKVFPPALGEEGV